MLCGPLTYSAARSTPGKRVMAKGAVLWDGSSPRLSSHSSFPTTGASLNPWPVGRRRLGGTGQIWELGGAGCPHLPEKPAPMMMLLYLGCRSRMKSPSGVFWGSHGVRMQGQGSSPGPIIVGKARQGPAWGWMPLGDTHRVEAGLHHGWPGLQPGQVAADEAAQEGDIGAGGTLGRPVPFIGIRGAAVVVTNLGGSRSGGLAGGPPLTPPYPAHLDQTGVLEGRQPIDAVWGLAQPHGHEAGTGSACTPGLFLLPVADVDAQGLGSQR